MRIVWAVLVVAACGKGDGPKPAAPNDIVKVLGKSVQPPDRLSSVTIGMRADDVRNAGLHPGDGPTAGMLVMETESREVLAGVTLDTQRRVKTIETRFAAKDGPALVTQAWGPPSAANVWTDKGTGWSATLDCDAGACALAFTKPNPLTAEMFPTKPGPPLALGGLNAGAKMESLRQSLLSPDSSVVIADGVVANVIGDQDGVAAIIEIHVPEPGLALIKQRWGLPTTVQEPSQNGIPGRKLEVWHEPIDKWRATLEGTTLLVQRYTPLGDLLGGGAGLNLFPTPPIGMPVADYLAAYKNAVKQADGIISFVRPPSDWDLMAVIPQAKVKDDKISEVTFTLDVPANARAAVWAALVQKWGEGIWVAEEKRRLWKTGPVGSVAELESGFLFTLR